MLVEAVSAERLTELLQAFFRPGEFQSFPPASDRDAWGRAHDDVRRSWQAQITAAAEAGLGQPWPELTAAMFMEYIRRGDRTAWETPYFERRNRLGLMVLAEALEYRGRFLEEIVNGLWHILGEVEWCVPSHCEYAEGDPLPRPYSGRVDLFCAVTGMVLAETVQVLGAELGKMSPSLLQLVRGEVLRRVVEPVEKYPDGHWWLDGFNNWTPWCASNVLGSALTFLDDRDRLVELTLKLLRANDRFIANYPSDGGCNEGPMYWSAAPGKLLVFLELLNLAAGDGYAGLYREPMIRNMGEYIAKVHLCGDWFLSAADSGARMKRLNMGMVYRYGEKIDSPLMQQMALAAAFGFEVAATVPAELDFHHCADLLTFKLRDWFWMPDRMVNRPVAHQAVTRLPDLQLFICREDHRNPERGLIFTAKGGHNGESHNHNDLGQFELFCDGSPVIVDTGVGTYTRQTFSERRYELWYIGAQGHNIPAVNGISQTAGARFHAALIGEQASENFYNLQLDLGQAYDEEALVSSYERDFAFDRKRALVTVTDRMALRHGRLRIELPLYCAIRPETAEDGSIRFQLAEGGIVELRANGGVSVSAPEEVVLNDQRLEASWGERLYRLRVTGEFASGHGEWTLAFRRLRNGCA